MSSLAATTAYRKSVRLPGAVVLRAPRLRGRRTSIYLGLFFVLSFASRWAFEVQGFRVRSEYILLAAGLIWLTLRGRVPNPSMIPGVAFLLGWLALNLISSFITAPVILESLKSLGLLVAGAFTLILISYLARRDKHDPIKLYLDVWFLSILVGVLGTGVDVLLGTRLVSGEITDVVTYRFTQGLFWEWNFYGIASMMLGIILLDGWVREFMASSRISIPYRLLICGLGIVLSATRSAQITFVLGAAFILVLRHPARGTWLPRIYGTGLVAAVVFGLFASGLVHTTYTDRIIGSFLSLDSSDSYLGRIGMVGAAINQMSGKWWLGHGTNTFGQINPTIGANGQAIYGSTGAYLSILPVSVLYDTGLVGLILVAAWLLTHHLQCFRSATRASVDHRLWPFAFSSALMFVTFVTTNGLLISFAWVHLAMTMVALRRRPAPGQALEGKPVD